MKQQKQAPSTMKVEIGGVEYTYELKEKEEENKCQFEVGDIVTWKSNDGSRVVIRLIENVIFNDKGIIKYIAPRCVEVIYNSPVVSEFKINENHICIAADVHTKATHEQEKLFKLQCLENCFWFDQVGKKWIELKEGGIYNVDGVIEIFDEFTTHNKSLNFKCTLEESGYLFELGYVTGYHNVYNISEATEEEKQSLFDALAKKGKQWNVEKSQIEDFMWVPKEFDRYVYYDAVKDKVSSKQNINTSFDRHMVNIGNCFKTESECEKYAKYMKKCSKNYKQLKEKLL